MMRRRFGLTRFSLEFVVFSLKFGFLLVGTLVFWRPERFTQAGFSDFRSMNINNLKGLFRNSGKPRCVVRRFSSKIILAARGDTFQKGVTSD